MWKRIKDWWAAEGAMVGLQGMSDRMLADMGLERADLRDRVMGAARDARSASDATDRSGVTFACRLAGTDPSQGHA